MSVFSVVFCSVFMVLLVIVDGFSRNLPIMSFDEGYSHLFGGDNLMVLRDGKSAGITLDVRTGSGFMSQEIFLHGYFSASIKLPAADYTAGVVVTFYMSNVDRYKKNHDEIDFEFLGNIRGKDWRLQTNVYGNGSTSRGREERYSLWFDPSEDFHRYSILWTENSIVFYVDDVPIRELERTESMGGDFPSKPMSAIATIWDGSDWATNGGKHRADYKYAPYIAEYSDFVLDEGARVFANMTRQQREGMLDFRKRHMHYSYCHDRARYKVPLPECPKEAEGLKHIALGGRRRRHRGKRPRRPQTSAVSM